MPSHKNSKQRPTGRFPSTSSATKPSERPAGHQHDSSILSRNPMVFQKETPNLTLRRPTQNSANQSADLENQTHSAPRPSNKRTGKGFLPTLRRWKKLAVFTGGATLLIITLLLCGPNSMGYRRRMMDYPECLKYLQELQLDPESEITFDDVGREFEPEVYQNGDPVMAKRSDWEYWHLARVVELKNGKYTIQVEGQKTQSHDWLTEYLKRPDMLTLEFSKEIVAKCKKDFGDTLGVTEEKPTFRIGALIKLITHKLGEPVVESASPRSTVTAPVDGDGVEESDDSDEEYACEGCGYPLVELLDDFLCAGCSGVLQ